jgi:archaellum component FlaG (FlaF/FlaG flagellin family)
MDTILNETEKTGKNYKGYVIGAVIGVLFLGALIFIASRRPSMEDQAAAILEGSLRQGDAGFDELSRDIIISTGDNTVQWQNAFGTISMSIVGRVKNRGNKGKTFNALEVEVAVIDQFNEVVKDKRVLVVPGQQPELAPGDAIPITLTIDGFKKEDDRANIRWVVTAIRTAN